MAGCIRYSLSDDLVSYRGGTGSTNITLICNIMHGQRVMMHGESSERTKEAKKLLEAQSSNWNSRQTIPFVSSLIHVWRDVKGMALTNLIVFSLSRAFCISHKPSLHLAFLFPLQKKATISSSGLNLRWLKTVSGTFQDLDFENLSYVWTPWLFVRLDEQLELNGWTNQWTYLDDFYVQHFFSSSSLTMTSIVWENLPVKENYRL